MPRFRSRILVTMLLGALGLGVALVRHRGRGRRAEEGREEGPGQEGAAAEEGAPVITEANKKLRSSGWPASSSACRRTRSSAGSRSRSPSSYDEKLKATTDVAAQDRIRKDRKAELARVKATYVTFEPNKPSPWDVSIIEDEFAHGTGESMMERWENEGGKNNRRFFFFYEGKLWKMFISLDVSILPEDKKNFETFQGVMQAQFGAGRRRGRHDHLAHAGARGPRDRQAQDLRRGRPRARGSARDEGRARAPRSRRRRRRRRRARSSRP